MITLKQIKNLENEEIFIDAKNINNEVKLIEPNMLFVVGFLSIQLFGSISALFLSAYFGVNPIKVLPLILAANYLFLFISGKKNKSNNKKLKFDVMSKIQKKNDKFIYDKQKFKNATDKILKLKEESFTLFNYTPTFKNVRLIKTKLLISYIENIENENLLLKEKNQIIEIIKSELTEKQAIRVLNKLENKFKSQNKTIEDKVQNINKITQGKFINTKNKKSISIKSI
jgi:hypothetical protein